MYLGDAAVPRGGRFQTFTSFVWPQVGNAVKSTLHGAALKSNNKEGARSIQVEITPTSSRISRNAVTSLSIRGHRWKRHGKTGRAPEHSEKSAVAFRGE